MRAAVGALASLFDGTEERHEVCVRADEECANLLAACQEPSDVDQALLHLGRLEAVLSSSLTRAATRCNSAADAVAVLEERLDEPAIRTLGISAQSVAALAERLQQAATDWDPT
jgi:hypothetical protein